MTALALGAILLICGAPPSRAASSPTVAVPPLDKRDLDLLREEFDIEARVRAEERKELVRSAPPGFKSVSAARKLKLTLVARDKKIRVGQTFWYRLELQNIGRQEVTIQEFHSFLKSGYRLEDDKFQFYAALPDGTSHYMPIGVFADEMVAGLRPRAASKEIPGWDKLSPQEQYDHVRKARLRKQFEKQLEVTLRPGETLVSRPWRWVSVEEHYEKHDQGERISNRPEGAYRELWTEFDFKTPGKHSIRVEFVDEPPPPPDEQLLSAFEKRGDSRQAVMADYWKDAATKLGRTSSNRVTLEVVP